MNTTKLRHQALKLAVSMHKHASNTTNAQILDTAELYFRFLSTPTQQDVEAWMKRHAPLFFPPGTASWTNLPENKENPPLEK